MVEEVVVVVVVDGDICGRWIVGGGKSQVTLS